MSSAAVLPPIGINSFGYTTAPAKTAPIHTDWHRYISNDPILQQLNKQNTCWERFKARFKRQSPLAKQMISISHLSQIPNSHLPVITNALESHEYLQMRPHLRVIMIKLTKDQRTEIFSSLVQKSLENNTLSGLQNCLALITWDELRSGLNITNDNIKLTIQCMAKCESILRERSESFSGMQQQSKLSAIAAFFHGLMDTLMMAFSFFEIGKEPPTSWDASYVFAAYGKILAAPVTLFTALVTVLPVVNAIAYTIAATIAVILFILAYIKWLKPCPEHIDLFQNLTKMAKEGLLDPVIGRDEDLERLIQCLASSNKNSRTPPMIIGESGIGKTLLFNGLAIRIAQGTVPNCLKNKKVFLVNVAKLGGGQYDRTNRVDQFMKRLGKNRDDVIICFDEIHNAFIDDIATKKIGEPLKNYIDTNPEALPYCIGATTKADFDKYITDEAFKRRFQEIHLKETDEDQTMWIMREMALRIAPDLNISQNSLKKIWDKTQKKKVKQPAISTRVLSKAISNVRLQQDGYRPSDDPLMKKRAKYEERMSAFRLHQDPVIIQEMIRLEKEIEDLEKERANEAEQLKVLKQMQNFRANQQDTVFKMAYQIWKGQDKGEMKKFILFAQEFLIPQLDKKIDKQKSDLKHTSLDEFIDKEV